MRSFLNRNLLPTPLPAARCCYLEPEQETPAACGFPSSDGSFRESGRQDLNLRPLGPEGASAFVDAGSPLVTVSHALDVAGVSPAAPPDRLAPVGTATIPRGELLVNAPVVLERLLTTVEVANHLGVCRATVYALCERGELPCVRVSNAIRIAPADLAEFIACRRSSQ